MGIPPGDPFGRQSPQPANDDDNRSGFVFGLGVFRSKDRGHGTGGQRALGFTCLGGLDPFARLRAINLYVVP